MEESPAYKKRIVALMVSYERRVTSRKRRRFDRESAIEWFYGVLFDQSVLWELAWDNVAFLKKRLGTLRPYRISRMPLRNIRSAIYGDKRKKTKDERISLHRYYPQMAVWLKESCRLLSEKYKGDPRRIWNHQRDARRLEQRLLEFHGTGQKKSSMIVNILATDYGLRKIDKRGIDVSVDRQVRRVFVRTGLSTSRSSQEIIEVARKIYPDYPGRLDLPAWRIGQDYCFPNQPDCRGCPLGSACKKKKWRKAD